MAATQHRAVRNPRAIEALYDQYGGVAFAFAHRLLGERGVAEDVVQEAFLKQCCKGSSAV